MDQINNINNLKSYNNILERRKNNYFLIYFTSKKCIELDEIYNNIVKNLKETNNIIFLKINVDNSPELVNHLDVTSYPVFRIYKNNINLKEICGTYDNIENILNNIISLSL